MELFDVNTMLITSPVHFMDLHAAGFEVAVETNGTLPAPTGIDWLCMSPKGHNPTVITQGQELKLVYPQAGVDPAITLLRRDPRPVLVGVAPRLCHRRVATRTRNGARVPVPRRAAFEL